ncbi:MAG: hypothetical protein ACKPKO_07195, partial [Candidatus Fonsibacter sp.]
LDYCFTLCACFVLACGPIAMWTYWWLPLYPHRRLPCFDFVEVALALCLFLRYQPALSWKRSQGS